MRGSISAADSSNSATSLVINEKQLDRVLYKGISSRIVYGFIYVYVYTYYIYMFSI